MFKKLAIVGVAVVAGVLVLNMTVAGSYVSTAWKKVRQGACNKVPLEFELDRVRHEVSKLIPDMKDNIRSIAEEMVAVDRLRDDIKVTRANLEKEKDNIFAMKKEVENAQGAKTVRYGDRTVSVSRLKDKLARDWDAYKRCEDGLASKEKLLDAKETALSAAREQLAATRAKKEQLEVEIARLDAEIKNVRVSQSRGNFQLDDSRLARINAAIASIRDRINVETRQIELEGQFKADLDVPSVKDTKTASDVVREIDNHFGKAEEVATQK
jgi:chromosome segregation ATPase